ncbi:MAG: hypothetical protein QW568_01515 [Candidatus Anstonellaceae archaeon]
MADETAQRRTLTTKDPEFGPILQNISSTYRQFAIDMGVDQIQLKKQIPQKVI